MEVKAVPPMIQIFFYPSCYMFIPQKFSAPEKQLMIQLSSALLQTTIIPTMIPLHILRFKEKEREAKEKETGKKPIGRTPKAPTESPNERDQYNFTDPESRIIKTTDGFDQCYNGQAAMNEDMIVAGAYGNAHTFMIHYLLKVIL